MQRLTRTASSLLQQLRPERVLIYDPGEVFNLESYRIDNPNLVTGFIPPALFKSPSNRDGCPAETLAAEALTISKQYDLCLIACPASAILTPVVKQYIAMVRNQHCPSIYLMLELTGDDRPGESQALNNTLYSLGFKRGDLQANGKQHICFSYDIRQYNKKRTWNNSRDWANPQNFDRFRW